MAPDASTRTPSAAALDRIKALLGPKGWTDVPDALEPWLRDRRGLFTGRCALMAQPASTEEVSAVVRYCAEHAIAIVPQGGNTSLCAAAIPHEHGREILLNLGRMNRIRDLDALNHTLTAEAGCVLQTIQEVADAADRLFPLSLAAEGSCQIGGNLSTNAGGVNVLRYGNARELVLGLEVVLPSGEVWNGLRRLRKDNTGYDLKQLFIGAEGTLGVITAAVLKLFPKPRDVQTCFAAVRDADALIDLLARARAASGDAVSSFEMIDRMAMSVCVDNLPDATDPLDRRYDLYALIEFSGARAESGMRANMEAMLESAFAEGLVLDATIAQSEAQRTAFWRIREGIPETQVHAGGSIKHDISVPVSRIPDFLERAKKAVATAIPEVRPCIFGHVGDGNLHANFSQPPDMDTKTFLARWAEVNEIVYDVVVDLNGSISAEHGIGRLKRESLRHYKPGLDLALMRRLKAAIDPHGIMNPGKVL